MKVFKIALFGPQGSGKGTQAELLSKELKLPVITPGNVFRQHVAQKTELGQQVEKYLNAGKLVPDAIANQIIGERLNASDCQNGFILDGYPRNKNQAEVLEQFVDLTHVIVIDIPDAVAFERITERWICHCGMTYHLQYKPPKKDRICDKCEESLYQRADDTREALKKRLEIYHQETAPLFKKYKKQKILHIVDGRPSIPEVWQQVRRIFPLVQ